MPISEGTVDEPRACAVVQPLLSSGVVALGSSPLGPAPPLLDEDAEDDDVLEPPSSPTPESVLGAASAPASPGAVFTQCAAAPAPVKMPQWLATARELPS